QIKSTPIVPFSITVNLNEDDIKISTVNQTNEYNDLTISQEEYKSGKIVEIRKNKGTDTYYLNGKELTQTEIENLNSDEKSILSFYQLAGSLNFETEILETTSDDGFGNIKQIKFLKDSSNTNQKKYLIIEKGIKETKEDSLIINLNEAGDYNSISTYNLKNTHPLIIIDGQESTENKMKKLPVNNIRTITILKDEAAVKKYGEQGNNGVIEVITNKN
ncbi:MAG: hypothetical protein V7734_13435, partial [Maribacter arcticus]